MPHNFVDCLGNPLVEGKKYLLNAPWYRNRPEVAIYEYTFIKNIDPTRPPEFETYSLYCEKSIRNKFIDPEFTDVCPVDDPIEAPKEVTNEVQIHKQEEATDSYPNPTSIIGGKGWRKKKRTRKNKSKRTQKTKRTRKSKRRRI